MFYVKIFYPFFNIKQEWECRRKPDGTLRMHKCRGKASYRLPPDDVMMDDVMDSSDDAIAEVTSCDCSQMTSMTRSERRRQQQFLADHVQARK